MADGLTLELSDDQMRQALSAALLASLDNGAREKIIAEAITYLTTEQKADGYSRRTEPSPIQRAFNEAIVRFAREWTEELIANDPSVKQAFTDAFNATAATLLERSEDFRRTVVDVMSEKAIKIVSY
jgi:hypothetical protein